MPDPPVDVPEGWDLRADGDAISREYRFAGFPEAMAFMASLVPHIERMNHHPEWANVYSRVSVTLTTHDAGTVTDKDLALARLMDTAAGAAGTLLDQR